MSSTCASVSSPMLMVERLENASYQAIREEIKGWKRMAKNRWIESEGLPESNRFLSAHMILEDITDDLVYLAKSTGKIDSEVYVCLDAGHKLQGVMLVAKINLCTRDGQTLGDYLKVSSLAT